MRAAWIVLGLTCGAHAVAQGTAPPEFAAKLREARYELRIGRDGISGGGAPVLRDAVRDAKYVLIGEDHLTREIPQFASAVCDVMAPMGFSAMVVEASQQAADFVSALFGKPDRLARMSELLHKYPDSIAFLDMKPENDLVAHCAEVSHNPTFHLVGLDQEFIGSAGWILDQILATHPGRRAATAIEGLRKEEREAASRAKESGDPSKLFLLSSTDSELSDAASVLEREGNRKANALFHEFTLSRAIYHKNLQGHAVESNDDRARMLKQNFRRAMESAGAKQKVLVKFGDSHLYKGYNDLNQRDLGNYIAEMAEGDGQSSLHISIMGAKGTHRLYGGYGRGPRLESFEVGKNEWLKVPADNQVSGAWTLFDLRKLRFQKFASIDPAMERVIYGYDLLVIVPELTPGESIVP